ncbi:DUF3159 domain-containing protein [Pseudofrankia sp. BMG5.36]|uniref:DUF3159 domain-containing protein n=1 Tax=Pseudofrankia sp. BMG5.36 TaxID=1834512 RepID=UPI0009F30E62|nr:DUF3159 domain-containing protein [Pseudofrankia sp. BMG5.36]
MPGLSPRGNNAPDVPPPGEDAPFDVTPLDVAARRESQRPRTDGQDPADGRGTASAEFKVSFSEAIGGPRGIVDSSLPTIAFVALNSAAGLASGIIGAVVVGVAIFILRMVRGEPKQQAFSGLLAVGVAGYIASRTGRGKDYFLVSILRNAGAVVVGVASLAVRRPLAGYVMAGLDQRYADWRNHRDTLRAANWATGVWIVVYFLRFAVQGVLYLADRDGWLAAANLALGLPLFGLAVLATLAIVRKLAPASRFEPPDAAEEGPADAVDPVADNVDPFAARAAVREPYDD